QHEVPPDRHGARPGEHVADDAGHDRAQEDVEGRDAGLVGQIPGEGKPGDPAPALGPAHLVAGARMRRDAGAGRGLPVALLALLAGLVGSLFVFLAHPALLWSITRPSLASASRWRSKTK